MKAPEKLRKDAGGYVERWGEDGCCGWLPRMGTRLFFIASWGEGWDHVSVSIPTAHRCPTWQEMCAIKDLFFGPEECVIQYHPPKADNISIHPYCLHLWRCQTQDVPMPPKIFVGL